MVSESHLTGTPTFWEKPDEFAMLAMTLIVALVLQRWDADGSEQRTSRKMRFPIWIILRRSGFDELSDANICLFSEVSCGTDFQSFSTMKLTPSRLKYHDCPSFDRSDRK